MASLRLSRDSGDTLSIRDGERVAAARRKGPCRSTPGGCPSGMRRPVEELPILVYAKNLRSAALIGSRPAREEPRGEILERLRAEFLARHNLCRWRLFASLAPSANRLLVANGSADVTAIDSGSVACTTHMMRSESDSRDAPKDLSSCAHSGIAAQICSPTADCR
jgi:hypothetical protein